MESIESQYGRSLKRKNFSSCTIKNYLHRVAQFRLWLRIPLPTVTPREIGAYVDHLLRKGLSPKTLRHQLYLVRQPTCIMANRGQGPTHFRHSRAIPGRREEVHRGHCCSFFRRRGSDCIPAQRDDGRFL